MIAKGTWTGQYKYDNNTHLELRGFEATNFEIKIIDIDNEQFTGKVQDDLSTGGTEGIGDITGIVDGDKIEFVKQMPVLTVIAGRNGTRKTFNKKHRKIYYSGILSNDGKTANGRWKFKAGFVLAGLMLIFGKGNGGTWTMKLSE